MTLLTKKYVLANRRLDGLVAIAIQDSCSVLTIRHGHSMDTMYVTVIFLTNNIVIELANKTFAKEK